MKREVPVLSALVIALSLPVGAASAAMIMIKGTSSGTAVAGPYERAGMMLTTSDAALKRAQDYVKRYDGDTAFTADYNIVLKPDNSVDSTQSTVKFTTSTFTSEGTAVKSEFMTRPITITGVMLMNGDPTMIASFMFNSTDWYPAGASGAGGINNNGLSGSINLKTGASSYTASYSSKTNGAVYTYTVTGMVMPPAPVPDPLPPEFGDPEIFSPPPIPEPTTWLLLVTGIVIVAFYKHRRIAAATVQF